MQTLSHLFWITATVHIVLALAFTALARGRAAAAALAGAQRKDDWLACAIIWMVIFGDGLPMRALLVVLGCIALAWLSRRAAARIRLLQGSGASSD